MQLAHRIEDPGPDPAATHWRGVTDLAWPTRSYPTVERILVGPGGVFVISVLGPLGRSLQGGRARDRAIAATAEAARSLGLMSTVTPVEACRAVVVLDAGDALAGASGTTSGATIVCHAADLVEVLEGEPAILGPAEVDAVADEVDLVVGPGGRGPRSPVAVATGRGEPPSSPTVSADGRPAADGSGAEGAEERDGRRAGPFALVAAVLPLVLLLVVPELYAELGTGALAGVRAAIDALAGATTPGDAGLGAGR